MRVQIRLHACAAAQAIVTNSEDHALMRLAAMDSPLMPVPGVQHDHTLPEAAARTQGARAPVSEPPHVQTACQAEAAVAQAIVTVVENQALVWLGAMYSPLMPIFGLVSNVIMFYTKLLLALVAYEPPHERYSVSRTSVMAYTLMLGASPCLCTVAWNHVPFLGEKLAALPQERVFVNSPLHIMHTRRTCPCHSCVYYTSAQAISHVEAPSIDRDSFWYHSEMFGSTKPCKLDSQHCCLPCSASPACQCSSADWLHGLPCAAGLLACSVPIVFTLEWKRTRCGPHQGSSMVQAVTSAAQNGPSCASAPCRGVCVLQWHSTWWAAVKWS